MTEEELKKEEAVAPEEVAEEAAAEESKTEAPEAAEAEKAPEEEPSGKFDKKAAKKKADKEREALKEQISGLEDRVKRQMAEFENFRKRTDREKDAMFDMGARSVLEKILPIVDNFERGLAMKTEEERTPFTDGMEMVYKQLQTVLEGMDVKPIEAVGHPFDPNFHNAIMQDTESDAPENTVVEEFQKGYTYKGNVIRYSMVKVKA